MNIWIVLIVPQNTTSSSAIVNSVYDSESAAEQQITELINSNKWTQDEVFLVPQQVQS
jgi:hypothetical protein